MAITKVSNSGFKSGMTKYDSFLAGNAAYDPAATFLIQRIAGNGSSTSITFSSIPQTYKHLQVRWIANDPADDTLNLRLNGDTGTNYAAHQLDANGASVSAGGNSSGAITGIAVGTTPSNASIFSGGIIDIHDYANTSKNKTVRSFSGADKNGSGYVYLRSGLWLNTAAVTSITLYTPSAMAVNSTFALYGFTG